MSLEGKLNGCDLFGEPIQRSISGPVAEKFGFPPFSVLDARSGEWQERKRAWLSIGLQSEIGRGANLIGNSDATGNIDFYAQKRKLETELGCSLTTESARQKLKELGRISSFSKDAVLRIGDNASTGTSVFDPTLCECAYRWFCPEGGQVVDPFAGGSVRGIVAGMIGIHYWGCDLRKEQIEANESQADAIRPDVRPSWVCGDSMETLESAPPADLVFSCPPYGDLEKYSDDPADLSAMEWPTFQAAYGRIILRCVKRMKENSFACFVVGDFRDGRGFYRDFVSTTIAAFRNAGAELYNEAVLVTSVGSASMRVTKQFESGRKFAKTHQNVLVFCKGDWKAAADKCNVGRKSTKEKVA